MVEVTPELKKLRDLLWGKALTLSVELQYSKRFEKSHQQGQYDAIKEIWQTFEFDNPEWTKEEVTHAQTM